MDVALPFVTGVGEITRATRTTVRVVSGVDDVVETAKAFKRSYEATSEVRNSTGFYVALYEKGQHYIGKGGFGRAITSAKNHVSVNNGVKAIIWIPTKSKENAFMGEYLLQSIFGLKKENKRSYNVIWSPGKRLFQALKGR